VLPRYRKPPPLYRLARALRRVGLVVLILIILFVASAAYSAYETARSGASASNLGYAFGSNNTIVVSGQFTFTNGGFYPVNGFSIHLRIANQSGAFLGSGSDGPVALAPGASQPFPLVFVLPIDPDSPAASLVTMDQNLNLTVFANATFGYLFPIGVTLTKNESWGAPFADFSASVGTPSMMGGVVVVPVTIQFQNHASFADVGTLAVRLVSSGGTVCGTGSFSINVPPQSPYSESTSIDLASGCSIAGGTAVALYTTGTGVTIALPPEAIP
jgi:hypothetical protein